MNAKMVSQVEKEAKNKQMKNFQKETFFYISHTNY